MRLAKKIHLYVSLAVLVPAMAHGQWSSATSVYQLRAAWDVPVIAGAGALSYLGFVTKDRQAPVEDKVLLGLDQASIHWYDGPAFYSGMEDRQQAADRSDALLYISSAAPLLLGLDKRVQAEWKPIAAMYMEAMMVNCGIHSLVANNAGRYRPITYVQDAPWELRSDPGNRNSFFSGHTSTVATATFFMAKVMNDMHPELGGKRWLLYGAAAVPTVVTGYYRVRAAKHFPSDVLVGAGFGALVGVLVPELHKRPLPLGISAVPFASEGAMGMQLAMQW